MSSQQQDIQQKRREKILSRVKEDSTEDPQNQSDPTDTSDPNRKDVFDRYRQLKNKQQIEKCLIIISKLGGLLLIVLSYFVDPSMAFSVFSLLLILVALYSFQLGSSPKQKQSWLTTKFPILQKVKYIYLIITISQLISYLFASFVIFAVFFNFIIPSTPAIPSIQQL